MNVIRSNTFMSVPFRKYTLLSALLFLIFFQATCTGPQTYDRTRWYKENYPMSVNKAETKKIQEKNILPVQTIDSTEDTLPDTGASKDSHIGKKEEQQSTLFLQGNDRKNSYQKYKNHTPTRLVYGYLENPIDIKYTTGDETAQQTSTTTMIEGKLYQLLESAYQRRDRAEYEKLKELLLQSFPNSKKKYALVGFDQSYYYQESLNFTAFQGSMADITYPSATSLQEMEQYFDRLQRNGVASVKINVVQYLGDRVFLFSKKNQEQGYYFKQFFGTAKENLFSKIVRLAHSSGLKIYASFPLRNHPNINEYKDFIMDEVWDVVENQTSPNSKLDILNPKGTLYLQDLLKELLKTSLDGIIFQDDFTYSKNEGFSQAALKKYKDQTGNEIHFNQMFVPVLNKKTGNVDYLTSIGFEEYSHWRAGEIRQTLWDLIDLIRKRSRKVLIGLEITSEMVSNPEISIPWYSTSLDLLSDLDFDLFILNQSKGESRVETAPIEYRQIARKIRRDIPQGKKIFLNVTLTEKTRNVIHLNDQMKKIQQLKRDLYDMNILIGPVDRTKNLDLFPTTTADSSQTSAALQLVQ